MKYAARPITENLIEEHYKFEQAGGEQLTREEVRTQLEDMKARGCLMYGPYCLGCPALKDNKCPCA